MKLIKKSNKNGKRKIRLRLAWQDPGSGSAPGCHEAGGKLKRIVPIGLKESAVSLKQRKTSGATFSKKKK
jgi:hypothetical protein